MQFKRRDILLGLMGLSLPLINASCSQNSPQTSSASPNTAASTAGAGQVPTKIRIGYQVYAGSELLAKGLGLAKQTFPNSQVDYLKFDAGRDVNTAFVANAIDFGVLGSAAAAVGLSRNIPYDVFYIYDLTDEAEALVVRPTIKTVADLKGKKIATPFSSTSHYSLLSLLKLEGVDQSELTILDMLPQDMLAAWQRGDIDGGYVWEPVLVNIEKDGGKILATSGDLAKRGHATLTVAVVSQAFAQQYPETVKQYTTMLDQAVKVYRQDAQKAGQVLAAELGVPAEDALSQASHVTWLDAAEQADAKYLGTADKPGDLAKILKDTADFMVSQKAIPTAPDEDTLRKHLFHVS
ncbi:MAG TPA: ABC transporter substrate-binding protein [Crinalium sp.]|jgi:taurine transport system substrate-binding protein